MKKVIIAITFLLVGTSFANARDTIHIVGSSTVFPFSTAVAEAFGKKNKFPTPIVESTGSGGGLKLFCKGIGSRHPDITNASRRIKNQEVKRCAENGILDITEVKIGFDGIVFASSKKAKRMSITLQQIFLALGKEVPVNGKMTKNPHIKWSDIDSKLPNVKIEVLGPPPTSGTRDAFAELAMGGGCKTFPDLQALKKSDKKKFKATCYAIREDGTYIEAGENDNLIVQKLDANPNALGVFGFSFLDQNADKLQGSTVNGVNPTFDNIASGKYKISRSLFFYVKKDHIDMIPGMKEYVVEFTAEATWGNDGYLADKGLIPLPKTNRDEIAKSAAAMVSLDTKKAKLE